MVQAIMNRLLDYQTLQEIKNVHVFLIKTANSLMLSNSCPPPPKKKIIIKMSGGLIQISCQEGIFTDQSEGF